MSDQPTDPHAMPAPVYPPPAPPSSPALVPPAPRRTSALTWVFAALMVLFLAGAGGLGYVYNGARGTVADQKSQIDTLQGQVDTHAKDLEAARDDLSAAEDDLDALRECQVKVQAFVDSIGGPEAEGERAALDMFQACDAEL